jgi:class 3 adenylate cyclase
MIPLQTYATCVWSSTFKELFSINVYGTEMQKISSQDIPLQLHFPDADFETKFRIDYDMEQKKFYVLGVFLSFIVWSTAVVIVSIYHQESVFWFLAILVPIFSYLIFMLYIFSIPSLAGKYQRFIFFSPLTSIFCVILFFQGILDFERPYVTLCAILTIQVFSIFLYRLHITFATLLIVISSIALIVSIVISNTTMMATSVCIGVIFNFAFILWFSAYYFERSARTIFLQKHIIDRELQRSESLLLNILPKSIAERLISSPGTIADGFDSVTILFADLVNFTTLAQNISPVKLVENLDKIFSGFDEIVEKYHLEKIKTIGDAYMVIGGAPMLNDNHTFSVLNAALAMQKMMKEEFGTEFTQDIAQPLMLRIGIASGPVVAGIIGKKKFSYDLWGDSVNVASRMESHGIPGEIQVTQEIYESVKDSYEFECRGEIEIKGKGKMQVWLLKSRKIVFPENVLL